MHTFPPTHLQILYWEIKNRSFYILFSFFLTFLVSYQNKESLLYLFTLSYSKSDRLQKSKNIDLESQYEKNGFLPEIHRFFSDERYLQFDTLPGTNKVRSSILRDDVTSEEKEENQFLSCDNEDLSLSVLLHIDKIINDLDISSISFIFTDVEEAFFCTILLCGIFSFMAILPFFIYQSFCFFSPSLHVYEKRKWIFRIFGVTTIWYCFIINLCSNLIPRYADFLLKFEISTAAFSVIGQTKIYSYCIWTISLLVTTSFIYFFSCFIFFLITNGALKIEYFTTRRSLSRGAILLISAFLVPPETQFLLALLFLFCFEGLIYFFFFYKNFKIRKTFLLSFTP